MNQTVEVTDQQLLTQDFVQDLRSRWDRVQGTFVDEPRSAVQEADQLVGQAIQRLSDTFTDARGRLEEQWSRGADVSTEDLRQTLQRYRAFFNRILAI